MSTIVENTTDKKTDGYDETVKKNKRVYLIITLVCFIIAIVVALIGIYDVSKTNKIKEDFTKTETVVVDCKEYTYSDDDNNTISSYTVSLEYSAGAKVYTYSYDSKSGKAIGEKMAFYYNPDNLKEGYSQKDLIDQGGENVITFLCTALMALLGAGCIYSSKKKTAPFPFISATQTSCSAPAHS